MPPFFRCKVQFQRDNGIRDEIQPKIRSLLSKNHLLFYRVQSNEIQILRVLHGSRDLSNQERLVAKNDDIGVLFEKGDILSKVRGGCGSSGKNDG